MSPGFDPPPRIDALTADAMAAVPDDDLEFSLADYVARRIATDGDEQRAIERLPPQLLTWYVAYIVDAEVLNGGFNQLFFNPSGQYAAIAPSAYQEIGAPEAGSLVAQALVLLEEHLPTLETAADEGTLEAFAQTYNEQPFEKLDSAWAAQEATWRAARLRYLRERATTLGLP